MAQNKHKSKEPVEQQTPVLFSGDDTERSDLPPSQPTPAMLSPDDVSTVPVPGLLQHLQNSGVTFLKVHQNTWQGDRLTTRLTKQFSVSFKVDTICTSTDIIEAFDKAGADIDDISLTPFNVCELICFLQSSSLYR